MRGRSLLRKSSRLVGVWFASWFGVVLCAPLAHAQDAPPPAEAPAQVVAPSASAPAADAPGALLPPVASPPPSSSAAPDGAAPAVPAPDGNAPATGSAAFEPLPGAPPEPTPKTPVPGADAAPPLADTQTPAPALDAAHHPSRPGSAAEAAPEPDQRNDDEGLFGPFRIGFLLGGGLPDLLSLGGQIKLTRYFGAGINVGIIPTVKLSLYGQAQISYQEYDLYGHIYPFGGAFFLGAGVGYATAKGSLVNNYSIPPPYNVALGNSASIESRGSVRTLVLTPQIGLLKTFGPGFSIGLDVGAQVPIAASEVHNQTQAPSYVPADQVKPYDDKVHSTLTSIGRQVLPTFNFKIGWLL
ncbi:MAG: hypothetical protein ABJB12_07765 [Pseudomonadota bacterium]